MTKGKRRKKPLSSMTMLKEDIRVEEKSSLEDSTVFSKPLGKAEKVSKLCEAPNCTHAAVCSVFIRDEEDFIDGIEPEEGTPYRACALHSNKQVKTFRGMKILNRIEEVVSDEEESLPNRPTAPAAKTLQQTPTEQPAIAVRVSPMSSPELQALLKKKGNSASSNPSQPNASLASSPVSTCEVQDCTNIANYEAEVENRHGLTTARVCVEHATDSIEGNKTTSLQLVNAENLSAYSMSLISISDNDDNDQVKNIVSKVTQNKPFGQTKGQKQSKIRRASDPSQKQTVTFNFNSDVDFPLLPVSKPMSKTPTQNVGVTKRNVGDSEIPEKRINKIAQPKKGMATPKGTTEKGPTPKKARTNKKPSNLEAMNVNSSSEEDIPSRFANAIIPTINHPIAFPKKPTNANALRLMQYRWTGPQSTCSNFLQETIALLSGT